MLGADIEFAQLVNRTAQAYLRNPPAYIAYDEYTHVSAPGLGRAQDINRSVVVRTADDTAIMHDLPRGAVRTGQAFPIIPYFDPISSYAFSWYANLKNVDITLERGPLWLMSIPPADPAVNLQIDYLPFWNVSELPGSTPQAVHLRVTPTSLYAGSFYPYDVVESPTTGLPSHIELRDTASDEVIDFDYGVLDGHWVVERGRFTATQHFGPLRFTVIAQTEYRNITFPVTAVIPP